MEKKIIGYKLKKEYPGSLKKGTEVRIDNLGQYVAEKPFWIFNCEDVKNFPEFWEPVYEEENKPKLGEYWFHNTGALEFIVDYFPERNIVKTQPIHTCKSTGMLAFHGVDTMNRKATIKEIKENLIIEARKRGFKEGVHIIRGDWVGEISSDNKTKISKCRYPGSDDYTIDNNTLYFEGYVIFKNGNWAEIISSPYYAETIKLKDASLWESLGSVVNTGTGKYMFLPYWIKKSDNGEEFEVYRLGDNLPPDLQEQLKLSRGIE